MQGVRREDRIARHVPRRGLQARRALALVTDPEQAGSAAAKMPAQMPQGAIVVARAASEPPAALVECDQRHEHEIELPDRDAARMARVGLADSMTVGAQRSVRVVT